MANHSCECMRAPHSGRSPRSTVVRLRSTHKHQGTGGSAGFICRVRLSDATGYISIQLDLTQRDLAQRDRSTEGVQPGAVPVEQLHSVYPGSCR